MLLRNIVPFPERPWLRTFIRLSPAFLLLAASAARAAAPVIATIGDQQVREGGSLSISLSATDTDGDGVNFSVSALTPLPGFCAPPLNGPGNAAVINCSPGAGDAGTYPVTVVALDDSVPPEQSSASFNIVVTANSAPNLGNISDQSVAEGATINIPLSASDPDGDSLVFSFSSAPGAAEGFCSVTSNGNGTGTLSCSPGAGDRGNYNVTVTVEDNAPIPLTDSGSFTLRVTFNTAPSLTNIGNQSVAEGNSITIPLDASDPDGDGLSFSESGLPNFCSLDDNGDGSGEIACSPGAGTGGSYDVTITVTDDAPVPLSASDSFTLNVSSNSAPNLSNIGNQSVTEGDSINIPLSASDPDGDNLAFSAPGLPGFCSLSDNGNGNGDIDCSPQVGDSGNYNVTVTVTDVAPIPLTDSDTFTLSVVANQAPTAENVRITGDPSIDSELTGNYDYVDAEGDPQGASTFRWLRNGAAISGATGRRYTVVNADVGKSLRFEVTPVAQSGATQGSPAQSPAFEILNTPPEITAQTPNPIEIQEDSSREITLDDLVTSDAEGQSLTVRVRDGANYTRNGNTITPARNFDGTLSVPVTVNDGTDDSDVFNVVVDVLPVNDAPRFDRVAPPGLTTDEDTTLTIVIDDLVIVDPDNDTFTLTLDPNVPPDANYTLAGPASVTPAQDFFGRINVRATVSDGQASSAPFSIPVDVAAINDSPEVVEPIGPQNAVEDSPFTLDVSANFADVDDTELTYTANVDPPIPPERGIVFDGQTGQFSGTPAFNDDDPEEPLYTVTITATDPQGKFVADQFELTISQLGRANLGLAITVSPETALPSEELRWTFTTENPIGPAPGENVQLSGRFIGDGLTVGVEGGANCTVNTQAAGVIFTCGVGTVSIGDAVSVQLSTTARQATEVVAFATSAGTEPIPIDPNPNNNSAVRAVGVADAFSDGAVQWLGDASVLSMAAGDVNGDGVVDIVVGTESGRPVQIYLGDEPRESCDCQRDFQAAPLTVPDTGPNRGVALADIDNNGTLDLVIANNGGQPDTVYANDGAGNFSLIASLADSNARDVAVGDFNGDGNLDIAVAAASPNLVYLGDGGGGFGEPILLGDHASSGVAAGRFNSDNLDDLVFANSGAASRVWIATAGGGFAEQVLPAFGDAVSVAAADFNDDGLDDIVFGRVSSAANDIPSNPVFINQGAGTFATPVAELGLSPTLDVLSGDVNEDGAPDIVFVNESGVHQVWTADGAGFALHAEQIIDIDARAGVLANLGYADTDDPGGIDLALGGADDAGAAVYLNDSAGNLGLGDAVPPVITLVGQAEVNIPAGTAYDDAGATAFDNIDGDISGDIVVNNPVNTAAVGVYTVTYNVQDVAGNDAVAVTRTVHVAAAAGRGGGGGGAVGFVALLTLFAAHLLILLRTRREMQIVHTGNT